MFHNIYSYYTYIYVYICSTCIYILYINCIYVVYIYNISIFICSVIISSLALFKFWLHCWPIFEFNKLISLIHSFDAFSFTSTHILNYNNNTMYNIFIVLLDWQVFIFDLDYDIIIINNNCFVIMKRNDKSQINKYTGDIPPFFCLLKGTYFGKKN